MDEVVKALREYCEAQDIVMKRQAEAIEKLRLLVSAIATASARLG